jgi:hypothetical protein
MWWKVVLACSIIFVGATCAGCVTDLKVGVDPWSVGIDAQCESIDGCAVGVEVGGWRAGFAIFPDVGPVTGEGDGVSDTD